MSNQEYYLRILEEEKGIIGRSRSSNYFKRLIKAMYKGFPNSRVSEEAIKSIVVTDEDRKFLVEHGFLFREPTDKGFDYGLGPNALTLLSAWKIEKLTENIKWLTKILLVFGAITIVLMLTQIII